MEKILTHFIVSLRINDKIVIPASRYHSEF